jgi:hypothetical protein
MVADFPKEMNLLGWDEDTPTPLGFNRKTVLNGTKMAILSRKCFPPSGTNPIVPMGFFFACDRPAAGRTF